ncbi:ABC transporter permease [Cellulomonas sp.]|uniref:ABC transporter permease n=1 Tax=Cellulomonas sp. TaxID=40001 RepID=UPI001B178000|nr:ABC transporter permease [Cellulomonas sp.]MBO9553343.1 ABC transporter permease [Cellulomonas sp.]
MTQTADAAPAPVGAPPPEAHDVAAPTSGRALRRPVARTVVRALVRALVGARYGVVVTVAVVGLWWLVCALRLRSAYVLPSPGRVWSSAVAMTASGELAEHVLASVGRVLAGFAIAFTVASAVGVLALLRPRMYAYLSPALNFLRNVPPLALIPLLILWFGIGETPKLVVIVLTAFVPMSMSITKGLRSCGQELLDVGTSLHFSRGRTFALIELPHALPDVLVGMRISLGYAWRALVGAEMFAAASGLGYLIVDAGHMSRADRVIVGVVAIGLVGVAADRLFALVVRRTLRWGIDDSWR